MHNRVDWLDDWLQARELTGQAERARDLREALRCLVLGNNGLPIDRDAITVVNAALENVRPRLDPAGQLRLETGHDALDEIVAIVVRSMLDGSWSRLKACRNCRWSFYDYSPNRSATWCSMQLCGNRTKTRAYRKRQRRTR